MVSHPPTRWRHAAADFRAVLLSMLPCAVHQLQVNETDKMRLVITEPEDADDGCIYCDTRRSPTIPISETSTESTEIDVFMVGILGGVPKFFFYGTPNGCIGVQFVLRNGDFDANGGRRTWLTKPAAMASCPVRDTFFWSVIADKFDETATGLHVTINDVNELAITAALRLVVPDILELLRQRLVGERALADIVVDFLGLLSM
jgi:hypothetical protein